MDALGIQRAVLAGRTGGTHEMTWIAEHHPERVAGLVYLQNLRVFSDTHDPLVRSFIETTWTTCHMGEESVARLGPRSAWRPHFLFDESATVNIPSIRFFAPAFEQHSRTISVLSRIEQWGSEAASRCADEVTREKYDALSKDKERVAALRKALLEADPTPQANRAMERAFGHYMTTIVLNEEEEYSLEFTIPHIDTFLEKVKTVASGNNE
jgi:pimeloyl-ACP methyl ester carboxylesterase